MHLPQSQSLPRYELLRGIYCTEKHCLHRTAAICGERPSFLEAFLCARSHSIDFLTHRISQQKRAIAILPPFVGMNVHVASDFAARAARFEPEHVSNTAIVVLGVYHAPQTNTVTLIDCALRDEEVLHRLPAGVEVVGKLVAEGDEENSDPAFVKRFCKGRNGKYMTVELSNEGDVGKVRCFDVALDTGGVEPEAVLRTGTSSRKFLDTECFLVSFRLPLSVACQSDGSWALANSGDCSVSREFSFRLQDGRVWAGRPTTKDGTDSDAELDAAPLVYGLGSFVQMLTSPLQFTVATQSRTGGRSGGGKGKGKKKKGGGGNKTASATLTVQPNNAVDDDPDCDGSVGCEVYPVQLLTNASAAPARATSKQVQIWHDVDWTSVVDLKVSFLRLATVMVQWDP